MNAPREATDRDAALRRLALVPAVGPVESGLDLDAVRECLSIYQGRPGQLVISAAIGGAFRNQRFPTTSKGLDQAVEHIRDRDAQGADGIYHRGTTARSGVKGRGRAEDSVEWLQFMLDLDFGKPGYPEDAATIRRVLDEAVAAGRVPEPTEWRFSGHGLYPIWRLARPVTATAAEALFAADVLRVATAVFDEAGYKIDQGVKDAARVWRIAGTVNRKDPDAPVLCRRDGAPSGAVYTVDELRQHFNGAPTPTSTPRSAAGPSPTSRFKTPRTPGRRFTPEQAKEYIEEHALAPVRRSIYGQGVNPTLNDAAVVCGHFVDTFWSETALVGELHRALIVDGPGRAAGWTGFDATDRGTIASGLQKGRSEPYELVEPSTAEHGAIRPAGRRLKLVRASQVRMRIARWLWDPDVGRIPAGELSLVAGRGNVGKSPFTLWLAAHATRGTLPGALLGTPRDVLVYASEDSIEHTIVPRLTAAGADLNRVHFIVGTEDPDNHEMPLNWRQDLDLIADAIREVNAAALVLDPLAVVYAGGTDTNNPQQMREALEPLVKLSHDTGCSTIGITHFNKGKGTDVAMLLSQSHALRDVARAVIVCVQDADGNRVVGQDKNNLGRTGDDVPCLTFEMESRDVAIADEHGVEQLVSQPAFVLTGTTDESLADFIGRAGERGDGAATTVPDTVRWMFDELVQARPYPMTAARLAQICDERGGPKWDSVRKAASRTRLMECADGREPGEQRPRWQWRLTDAGASRAATESAEQA